MFAAPVDLPGCKNDNDCPSSETCLNRQCINPCLVSNPCARNAHCEASNHRAICKCPSGLTGDPFINCYQGRFLKNPTLGAIIFWNYLELQPLPRPECEIDNDCGDHQSCINQRCQNPCTVGNPCGTGAQCRTQQHRPTCVCPDGWGGNPQNQCYKSKLTNSFLEVN